jgi:predicted transcriptional regulator
MFKKIATMICATSIMTPRNEFEYCRPKDLLSKKLQVMEDRCFDAIPILRGKDLETGCISGYLDQETTMQKMREGKEYCEDASTKIDAEDLLKEDLHIKDVMFRFSARADKTKIPFFVVNSANRIIGLTTLADLDKIAVKMYLFALISELELSLLQIVSKHYRKLRETCTCKYCYRKRTERQISPRDSLEEYYYLYIKELLHIIIKSEKLGQIQKRIRNLLTLENCDEIAALRNEIAHPKPLVSGKFPINRLVKVHNLLEKLIFMCKLKFNTNQPTNG